MTPTTSSGDAAWVDPTLAAAREAVAQAFDEAMVKPYGITPEGCAEPPLEQWERELRDACMAAHPAGKGRKHSSGDLVTDEFADEHRAPVLWLVPDPKEDEPLSEFEERLFEHAFELAELLVSKQRDYGPHAISRAPGGALNGVLVRIHDKVERLKHLSRTDVDPDNEPVVDSYRDLAGYALIALMVIEGTWPE